MKQDPFRQFTQMVTPVGGVTFNLFLEKTPTTAVIISSVQMSEWTLRGRDVQSQMK